MRVLHFVVILAVVLGTTVAAAQEAEEAKDKPLPWWKLSGDDASTDQPQAKDADQPKQPVDAEARAQSRVRNTYQKAVPPTGKEGLDAAAQRNRSSYYYSARTGDAPKPEPRERLVYRLANMPASEVARTVNELLRSERAIPGYPARSDTVVLAEMVSNSLIISGTSDAIHETVKFVEQLDTEPLMVCVQVVVGLMESREGLSLLAPNPDGPELACSHEEACELIEQFSKSDAVKILARLQLMTLDNQPAFLQVGNRVPRAKGTKDGAVTSVELENVGLIVGLTPRISSDHTVTMELDVEKSQLGPVDEGIPVGVDAKGNVIRSPKIEAMVVQTTVKIPPSRAVIIGGLALQDGDDRGELVMVVTPHVVARKK